MKIKTVRGVEVIVGGYEVVKNGKVRILTENKMFKKLLNIMTVFPRKSRFDGTAYEKFVDRFNSAKPDEVFKYRNIKYRKLGKEELKSIIMT